MSSSKSRGHFRKKPTVIQIPSREERHMWEKHEKDAHEKDPHGPPKPAPAPGDPPPDEPTPSHGPHWHEGDPEPKDNGD